MGRKLIVVTAVAERDIEPAFARAVEQRAGALLVRSDVLFNGRPKLLVALAKRHALPAIYPLRDFATAGGLMSYGASLREALRQTGIYAGRILKGEKPGELPVQQSAKVELVVNLKTAKALSLAIPLPLLGRADEVIEEKLIMSVVGTSRHFAATQQFGRFRSEADIQRAALTEPDFGVRASVSAHAAPAIGNNQPLCSQPLGQAPCPFAHRIARAARHRRAPIARRWRNLPDIAGPAASAPAAAGRAPA